MPDEKYKPKYFTPKEIQGLVEEVVRLADQIREATGMPLVITSGKRPGSGGSAHDVGQAIDTPSGSSRNHFKYVKAAIENGCKRMGVYVKPFKCPHCTKVISKVDFEYGHFHFDKSSRPNHPQEVLWIGISK